MIDRRNFITTTVLGAGALAISCATKQSQPDAIETAEKPRKKKNRYNDTDLPKFLLKRLTEGPNHHFFGYYGVSPWNREESVMVGMQSTFQDPLHNPRERPPDGLIDPMTGKNEEVSQTLAWNPQQGTMPQ